MQQGEKKWAIHFVITKKSKFEVISGCGWRVAYNRRWIYCPYCGKRISKMLVDEEDE